MLRRVHWIRTSTTLLLLKPAANTPGNSMTLAWLFLTSHSTNNREKQGSTQQHLLCATMAACINPRWKGCMMLQVQEVRRWVQNHGRPSAGRAAVPGCSSALPREKEPMGDQQISHHIPPITMENLTAVSTRWSLSFRPGEDRPILLCEGYKAVLYTSARMRM